MRSELQRSGVRGLLHARSLQHRIFRLRYAVLPHTVVVLVNLLELPRAIDFDYHAHVACKLLSMRLDDHLSIRPNNVVDTAAVPDLLENGAFGCGMNRLSGSVSSARAPNHYRSSCQLSSETYLYLGVERLVAVVE